MFLPPEIIEHIISFLPLDRMLPLKGISRAWNGIIKNYLRVRKITTNVDGLILDYLSRKDDDFLSRLLMENKIRQFHSALLIIARNGYFEAFYRIFKERIYQVKTSQEFDVAWKIPDVIHKVYLEAVHHNQINFLDQFLELWKNYTFPIPQQPYSYETALWLHEHQAPQYQNLYSYYYEHHNSHVEDLISMNIVKCNSNDYYYVQGKCGIDNDCGNIWIIFGAIEGDHLELANLLIDNFGIGKFIKNMVQIFGESFDPKLSKTYIYIIHHYVYVPTAHELEYGYRSVKQNQFKLKSINWADHKLLSYVIMNLGDKTRDLVHTIKGIVDHLVLYAEMDEMKKIFKSYYVREQILTSNLCHMAIRSTLLFKYAYRKVSKDHEIIGLCAKLLFKKYYDAYLSIHEPYNIICTECKMDITGMLYNIINDKKYHLVPYFIKCKKTIVDNKIKSKYVFRIPNIIDLVSCNLHDIKYLLSMECYHQKTNLFEYYENNLEMLSWSKANKIIC